MTATPEVARATLIGATAVLLWATLALLTTLSGAVPPFQLVAMAFGLAFLLALGGWLLRGEPVAAHLRQPTQVWALGIGGLFGYHFFYFMALRNAPPVEASLINYLWPLLIVLFSALLPGERLRWFHVAGALAGLAGTMLLIAGDGAAGFAGAYWLGYLAAFACAFVWAGYSVLSRRFGQVPTHAVGGFCGATALLAFICHLLFETTVWPVGGQWLAVLALGLGPVGAAFFVWDHGVKRGDIRALGAFAYAAPLLSTVLLVAFGQGAATWRIAAACLLITGGAALAAGDLLRARR
ncbi:MAG TPA: DMT family transporter [Alphaproteobacteria bacterium]|jgi:drug/metabolite transporter (DMT)-like permease